MPIATRHLASLSCQTIEIRPNELGCFSEEVADGLSVCTAIDILAEFLMATYMDGWNDDDEQEKKI
jgi:hypothetical protein